MEIPLTGSANLVIPDQHVARALMELLLLLAQVAMTTGTSMEPGVLSAALRSTWLKSDTCVWRETGRPPSKAASKCIVLGPGLPYVTRHLISARPQWSVVSSA